MKTKTVTRSVISAFCALALLGSMPGCGNMGALPFVSQSANVQGSTYSVQAAEHALRAAKDSLDLLLNLDDINRALVKEKLPQVHAFAEKMRRNDYAINLLQRADNAKNVFKNNRTADNQASLNTIMATVASLKSDLDSNTTKIQRAKA